MSSSVPNLTETSCRICLTNCSCGATNISDVAELFYDLVGYKIVTSDLPKKICAQCLENLVLLKSFKETCDETEKVLQELRQKEAMKDEVFIKIETDPEIFLKEENFEAFPLEKPPSETFLDTKESKVIQKTVEIKSRPSRKGMKYRKKGDPTPKETKRKSKYVKKIKIPKVDKELCVCEHCGAPFRKDLLFNHIRSVHENFQYECDFCGIKYKSKIAIERHITSIHLKIVHYKCEECGKNFKYLKGFEQHKNLHSSNRQIFACDMCDKTFLGQKSLEFHKTTHSEIRLISCPQCDARFQNLSQLAGHRHKRHPTKTFPCLICGKVWKNNHLLSQHKRSHEPNKYVCPVCPSVNYALAQSLRQHMATKHPDYEMPPPGTALRNVDINELKQKIKFGQTFNA